MCFGRSLRNTVTLLHSVNASANHVASHQTKSAAFGCQYSLLPHLLRDAPLVPPTRPPLPSLSLHIPNRSLFCFFATALGQLLRLASLV